MPTYLPTASAAFSDTNPMLVSSAVSANAVAANTVLSSVTVSSMGTYRVTAMSFPGGTGTIANTDAGNVLLKKNGNVVAVVPQTASAANPPLPLALVMTLNTNDVVTMVVGPTNAAPASVYYVSILTVQLVS